MGYGNANPMTMQRNCKEGPGKPRQALAKAIASLIAQLTKIQYIVAAASGTCTRARTE